MNQEQAKPEKWTEYEDDIPEKRHCEQCGKMRFCELIPLHGYSKWFCARCAAKAYRIGEAI